MLYHKLPITVFRAVQKVAGVMSAPFAGWGVFTLVRVLPLESGWFWKYVIVRNEVQAISEAVTKQARPGGIGETFQEEFLPRNWNYNGLYENIRCKANPFGIIVMEEIGKRDWKLKRKEL